MAKTNARPAGITTHEGARAMRVNAELQLRRSVMSCMLWEGEFYEDGQTIADRIKALIPLIYPVDVAAIAVEAREKMKLRHVPLLIVREMARLDTHKQLVAKTLEQIIQRADELSEFLAIYWKDGKQPLSAQVKKGLAAAFRKFNEYSLAKYDRDGAVKLRDVLFLCHASPNIEDKDKAQNHTRVDRATKRGSTVLRHIGGQGAVWKKLVDKQLAVPDTWEVELSASKDKIASWTRLLSEQKLGALALLRNLRNMREAGVPEDIVLKALREMRVERVLPFRFIAAARHAPQWEPQLETAMLSSLGLQERMDGRTILLIDVSGSMDNPVSAKSDITRLDAACGVAMLGREIFNSVEVLTFSTRLVQIPARRGFALRDAIVQSQPHGGTYLGNAVRAIAGKYERLIVITDEQSHDSVPSPSAKKAYMINVASNQNGIGYGPWVHIDGWSEAVIDYIREYER